MLIAVELDPPIGNADGDALAFLRDGAIALWEAGAACITMADNPRAISRGDSVALAALVHTLTGVPVIPHITCRDRNALAIRSGLTALDIAGIHEILVVTGDPIRAEDKTIIPHGAQMCSADLSRLIRSWNENRNGFSRPFYISAAINIHAYNFDAELRRAERKIVSGASRLFTQPVFSEEGIRNIERARRNLDCEIFGGILPVVSHKNAVFLSSAVQGISIDEELVEQYDSLDKEECAALAVSLSLEFALAMENIVDGYYLITPFRRIDIIEKIIREICIISSSAVPSHTQ